VKPPDLRVIDNAILRIQRESDRYTCVALIHAVGHVLRMTNCYERLEVENLYIRQYRHYVTHLGFPKWWGQRRRNKKQRIAALEAFKQACIDAGRKV